MYLTFFDIINPNLKDFDIFCMDCDSFFLSFEKGDSLKDLSKVEDEVDFCNIYKNLEQLSIMKQNKSANVK